MSNNLEEIDRHIEVLSSRWPKPYRQLEDAMVARSLLVASQIAHHRETTAAYGMAIRKQERIEEAERECAALKARLAEAERLLIEAHGHLEYCGYGDRWERECAMGSKLPERLSAFIDRTADSASLTQEPKA